MNGMITLAEAAALLRPPVQVGNWVFLLLLFLALLRKLGLLPDKDDDQYTGLGVPGGFAAAADDAKAKIDAGAGDPNTKKLMKDQVDYWRKKYQTGNVSLV